MRSLARGLPRHKQSDDHHAALAREKVPEFVQMIRTVGRRTFPATRRSLEFIVLTACRSAEAREATWDEIDFEKALWTIPAERTKTGRVHRVPLSDAAIAVLRECEKQRRNTVADTLIFEGAKRGRPVSAVSVLKLCQKSEIECTPHGMRSSFRDWGADNDIAPREVMEAAIAHLEKSDTVRAYNRTDYLDRRVPLMEKWGAFIAGETGAERVVAFKAAG